MTEKYNQAVSLLKHGKNCYNNNNNCYKASTGRAKLILTAALDAPRQKQKKDMTGSKLKIDRPRPVR